MPTSTEENSLTLHRLLSETRGWQDTSEPEPIEHVRKTLLTRQRENRTISTLAKMLATTLA